MTNIINGERKEGRAVEPRRRCKWKGKTIKEGLPKGWYPGCREYPQGAIRPSYLDKKYCPFCGKLIEEIG